MFLLDQEARQVGRMRAQMVEKEKRAVSRLRGKVRKLKEWLKNNEDKPASRGGTKQSNITDNESAKMVSNHGVVQGYNGQAAVDSKHQS